MRSRFTGLWRHPDFLRLWAGETMSVFGSLVGMLALQLTAVIFLDASPWQLSALAASQLIPGFLVGLIAGVWVDRLPRRPIMIAADLGRAAMLVSVPVAAIFDALTIEQLYIVGLGTSALTVFFDIAYQSYLPTLIRKDQLVEGNSKLQASASVAEVGSFSAAGWLAQLITGPGAVLVNALTFIWSAIFISSIKTPEPPSQPVEDRTGVWHEAKEGMRVVWHTSALRWIAGTNIILECAGRIVSVVLLLYLVDVVGFGPGLLGMIFAVGGVTSLAGAAFAGRSHLFGGFGPALVLSIFVRATGMLFMPLAVTTGPASISFLVGNQILTDPAWTYYNINDVSLRQGITPEAVQGRMFATFRFLEFGAMLLGTLLGGLLGELIGLRETLFAAVALTYAGAVFLAFSPISRLQTAPIHLDPEPVATPGA